ncbi:dual specificity protein phosphatase 1B-like isoform X2 [Punica granatum]|uniref:Dual specificity protein phosphatase 1B-like isoform X2 n=1 Tax=Punica granatum TaxID=22663 RepID=A0A218WNZ1_PUNGR|nr:dual specificity protein phosphatase 1B-like isoform X2 [Punica granatum]OWM74209.1 hypothetical protein CDL15_Pgr008522 [Punica granatum]
MAVSFLQSQFFLVNVKGTQQSGAGRRKRGLFSTMSTNMHDMFFLSNNMCEIEKGLFLGAYCHTCDREKLKSSNITHVLSVANLRPTYPDEFIYKVIDVLDMPDASIKNHFDECFEFIDEAKRRGGSVLVHCFMGVSRSVTVVVAYLMKKRGMSLSQALEHVKQRRPQASPNIGFIQQLQDFQNSL